MATLGSKDISKISIEELTAAFAKAGNTKAQQSVTATTPAPTPAPAQNLGSKDIKDISQKELVDAFAKAGNTKAQDAQKNNYTLPTPTQTKTSPSQATAPALPTPEKQSSLVDFANALEAATSLARSQRNASELGILEGAGFTPGKVRVGDMAHILNLLDTRSSTRTEFLQEQAVSAYQEEQKQNAQEREGIQNLGLSLLSSGKIDPTTLQGLLNAPDLNSAMLVAAGAVKASNKDVTDVREVGGTLVSVNDKGEVSVLYDPRKASSAGGGGSTTTGDGGGSSELVTSGGYEKSGSGNPVPTNDIAPRTQQVIDGFTTISSLTPTEQAKVRDELYSMGFGSSTPPSWFEDYYNATTGFQNILNDVIPINSPTGPSTKDLLGLPTIEQAWNTYRNKILGDGQSKSSSSKGGGLGDYSSY